MISEVKRRELYKQGYRFVGNHSAVKVCTWTKKALKCEDVCYKNTFYDINTHLCVQMTPALQVCTHRCSWCWRDIAHTVPYWEGPVDEPDEIIEGCLKEHVKYLQGFGGNEKVDLGLLKQKPKHFAISLAGEPTFYPKLPQLIERLTARSLTSFLVTNGTNPSMLDKISQPTQLYITLPAPDKETYLRVCLPLIQDGWEKITESLKRLQKFQRNVLRLTLVKDKNMLKPESYAKLIRFAKPRWVEAKAYVWVGYSRFRLNLEHMPRHTEIMKFSKELSRLSGYKILNEKKESRVVLLGLN